MLDNLCTTKVDSLFSQNLLSKKYLQKLKLKKKTTFRNALYYKSKSSETSSDYQANYNKLSNKLK